MAGWGKREISVKQLFAGGGSFGYGLMFLAVISQLKGGIIVWVCRYFFWFIIYSFAGWICETVFHIIRYRKWANRGFLYGPICPIYGCGAIVVSAILEWIPLKADMSLTWWQIFLFSCFGSMILEYMTSLVLEKKFHAYWWDYSKVPLNINGRVCVPFSVLFGCGGLLVAYVIYPFIRQHTVILSPAFVEFFALIFMLLFGIDLAMTVSALTNFAESLKAAEESLNQHMEHFVQEFGDRVQGMESVFGAERERFFNITMESVSTRMSRSYHRALSRVKGMRLPKQMYSNEYANRVLAHIKTKVRNKNKSNE